MKTTFALLIATLGLTASAFAGPSVPGGVIVPRADKGTACSMTKQELIPNAGRGTGPIVVNRKVNCTGQSCCAAAARCCSKKG